MKNFAVTFGLKYSHEKHPILGDLVDTQGFLLVRAPSEEIARRMLTGLTEQNYAFMYPYNTPEEIDAIRKYQPNKPFATLEFLPHRNSSLLPEGDDQTLLARADFKSAP